MIKKTLVYAASVIGCSLFGFSLLASPADKSPPAWSLVTRLGGPGTVYAYGETAFTHAVPGVSLDERIRFSLGSEAFNQVRNSTGVAPSEPIPRNSIDLRFNGVSCAECHVKNGRSLTFSGKSPLSPLVVKLETGSGAEEHLKLRSGSREATLPEVAVDWKTEQGTFRDGDAYALRWPELRLKSSLHSPFDIPSLRASPVIYGLGLLEAVDDATLVSKAREKKYAKFGIHGQTRELQAGADVSTRIGRYGWKADQATLASQVIGALSNEMGLEVESHHSQGNVATISEKEFLDMVTYMRLLGVNARAAIKTPAIKQGARLFSAMQCAMCHTPQLRTGLASPLKELRNQTIYPYSDLLLHDMGPRLSSGKGPWAGLWRTPPLWGLGVQAQVTEQAGLLHDGRARNYAEAVLWHGGEAETSKQLYLNADRKERLALSAFLDSL
jgi:CxxC motif-containing protein (DUF1111 family)